MIAYEEEKILDNDKRLKCSRNPELRNMMSYKMRPLRVVPINNALSGSTMCQLTLLFCYFFQFFVIFKTSPNQNFSHIIA